MDVDGLRRLLPQWFGSQLQLTPHLHLLAAEAMWQTDGTVVPVAPPSDEEVARILARVLRAAKKDWADLEAAWPEDEYEQLQQQAIQGTNCQRWVLKSECSIGSRSCAIISTGGQGRIEASAGGPHPGWARRRLW